MILQLQNVSFTFPGKNHLLDKVSLNLEEKKIYALMGSNGAGKTTLFNLIMGFMKPQYGDIFFEKKNITGEQPYKINRLGICRTFQDLRLITKLTVKENIVLAMKDNPTDRWLNAMFPGNILYSSVVQFERRADEIIEQFFLNDVRDSLGAEISYGQQKLLSLACCLANEGSLLLLDEAVAGIQPEYRNKIAILIKKLREQGKTILLIEHNTEFITEVADKIFFLHEGKTLNFDDMVTLRADQSVANAYL